MCGTKRFTTGSRPANASSARDTRWFRETNTATTAPTTITATSGHMPCAKTNTPAPAMISSATLSVSRSAIRIGADFVTGVPCTSFSR